MRASTRWRSRRTRRRAWPSGCGPFRSWRRLRSPRWTICARRFTFAGGLADYLAAQIAWARDAFGFECELVRSSALNIDEGLRAQDRILAILKAVGGDDYLNAPGGRELYDPATFAAHGSGLRFLPDWQGGYESVLQRLAQASPEMIRAEILAQTPPKP